MKNTREILSNIWQRGTGDWIWRPWQKRQLGPEWIERWAMKKGAYDALDMAQPWHHDLYFTPLTFMTDNKRGVDVSPGAVLFADLDGAHPDKIPIKPSIAWETSPGMYQAVWFTAAPLSPAVQQDINRRMTYYVGADKGGWQTSKVLRVPETLNFKRQGVDDTGVFVPRGKVLYATDLEYSWHVLDHELPPVGGAVGENKQGYPDPQNPGTSWRTVPMPMRLRSWLFANPDMVDDRSIHIWKCAVAFAQSGLDKEYAFQVLHHRPWNKYRDRPEMLWRTICQAYEG